MREMQRCGDRADGETLRAQNGKRAGAKKIVQTETTEPESRKRQTKRIKLAERAEKTEYQLSWDGRPYRSLDYEMKQRFGGKVWKLSLQSGCSCPNRDGTCGIGGCIFCSEGGSGDFAAPACLPVQEQIALAKARVAAKLPKCGTIAGVTACKGRLPKQQENSFAGYMAYFQSFTNTYGPVGRLHRLFEEAIAEPDVLALSIGTRPDCLPDEMIAMLAGLNRKKPVYVELGLQTIHEETAALIRRGYALPVFEDAVRRLKAAGLSVVVHLIIGLPNESRADIEESVRWVAALQTEDGGTAVDGIKLQLLHVLKGTELGRLFLTQNRAGTRTEVLIKTCVEMRTEAPAGAHAGLQTETGAKTQAEAQPLRLLQFSMEEYVDFVIDLIELLPPEMTVHRLTGDAPKSLLLAPLWSADKKRVLNAFTKRFAERGTWQGRRFVSRTA